MNPIWVAIIILVVVCCDALRDRWISRNVGWWQWHIVKWIAFYPPLATLVILFVPWIYWAPLVMSCWILWRVIYRYGKQK